MQGALAHLVPFRLQFYCNGHSYLARQMDKHNIEYRVLDNAFGWIGDYDKPRQLADEFRADMLHRNLDECAARFCPVSKQFDLTYHWSLDQVEFATGVRPEIELGGRRGAAMSSDAITGKKRPDVLRKSALKI